MESALTTGRVVLFHVTLHNCCVGNNVLIENIQNYIANLAARIDNMRVKAVKSKNGKDWRAYYQFREAFLKYL